MKVERTYDGRYFCGSCGNFHPNMYSAEWCCKTINFT